ncbi:TIGR03617 family F420-dependent LLM class oxidoreductase [Pseudonocardia acidicola]|uniref:TIGR03617 family F420-dependent LLM class oxidoreductase n=1 Tax=Pseudonocardia acidicola TaxID=2724939 RepID=A0ABX1SF71_9PSEU|nr:TIGR03617 family F420-dependent LLM class oxidoreductase [Pseudonocardia acidicola]NMI00192.1 TIGR03617 family F420-dependent LLM class oxidoreductase [Pseudonocardia acidicola]
MKIDHQVDAPPQCVSDQLREAEAAGYHGVWLLEAAHDPFLSVGLGAQVTSRVEIGTGIAVAFARSPMTLAITANDLRLVSQGRFLLGLGSQIKPHITRRFSMPWSHPAARMREYVLAVRAIWNSWHDGTPLQFEGEFYRHTLMTPMFDPGPNPYGNPPILLAGVGESMTGVAGEVADGFICHGFTTERYLREVTLPTLGQGRRRAGRSMEGYEIAGMPFVVTGTTAEEFAAAKQSTKEQIAFYASTPAYRPVLERHGWGELQSQLNVMSKAGRWKEMADVIDDEVLEAIAVVAEPDDAAAEIRRRYGDVFTRMNLYLKAPLPAEALESIVAALR